jgi:hypothetical protein
LIRFKKKKNSSVNFTEKNGEKRRLMTWWEALIAAGKKERKVNVKIFSHVLFFTVTLL